MLKNPEKMYFGAPWCLGSVQSLEVHKPVKITFLGHDYVIWRDYDDNVYALDNICPHAGASLGNGGTIVETVEYTNSDENRHDRFCLKCPYHGHKVQFLSDGRAIIDGKKTSKAIQTQLPLMVKKGLIWSYGIRWEKDGEYETPHYVNPKMPIPDYSHPRLLVNDIPNLDFRDLHFNYRKSVPTNQNVAISIYNFHDGEHFAGSHENTMLAERVEVKNLVQNDEKISWELMTYKMPKHKTKGKKTDKLVIPEIKQVFHAYNPGFGLVHAHIEGSFPVESRISIVWISIYPQTQTTSRVILERYLTKPYNIAEKLLGVPKMLDMFTDSLFDEDISVLSKVYPVFDRKINLKYDTPALMALDYLDKF